MNILEVKLALFHAEINSHIQRYMDYTEDNPAIDAGVCVITALILIFFAVLLHEIVISAIILFFALLLSFVGFVAVKKHLRRQNVGSIGKE